MKGTYYLHSESKDLIWRREGFEPEADSPFVQRVWAVDTENRLGAWEMALEALELGANLVRMKELAEKWGLTPMDSLEYLARTKPTPERKARLLYFMEVVWGLSEEVYWNRLDEQVTQLKAQEGKGKGEGDEHEAG